MVKLYFILSSIAIVVMSVVGVISVYEFEKNITSHWDLADKSSTIEEKSKHIDKFVATIEGQYFEGQYNAILLKTPNNAYDENIKALKSLQQRLNEIKTMDVTSFEYQKAIEQITGQEQGEASEMLSVFQGLWFKKNFFILWDWIGWAIGLTLCIVWCASGIYLLDKHL